MSKFKIGYFADGPWSHRAFELLQDDKSIEISFIVPRIKTDDDSLSNYAEQYNIDYLHPVRVNSDAFKDRAMSYGCDLFVSMSFNQIFEKGTIHLPRLNTINCHAGELPFYRGRNVLNWALINDEDEFGITVHFIDEGIDTGDIILQKTFPITDKDDYSSILEIAYKECANLLYNAVKNIQSGNYDRISQDTVHPVGSYCGRRTIGDEIIEWDNTSREIFNFVRALAEPGPKATSFIKGNLVKINKAKMIDQAPAYKNIPGQILKKTENGYLVKTKDTFIEILEIETDTKLRVGDRFEDGEL